MAERVRQCDWRDGRLIVETESRTYEVSSTVGIKALKANLLGRAEHGDLTDDLVLFQDDDLRRMALIQEKLSGIKD